MSDWTYTCTGCNRVLDPAQLEEYGHVCDGWWDEHGIYDELPRIRVEAPNQANRGSEES
ncbi:hypothetical protein [Microbacterium luteum]|uniref:hypothetical protein n=1 Tax=Microbacterium luteum TaxID=2782167 RepID=UPI001886F122|nr:hypothetical protein [Microbacterium luteum]